VLHCDQQTKMEEFMLSQDFAQAPTNPKAATFSATDRVAFNVVGIGGLNWDLIGAFSFDAMYTATKLAQPL